MLMKLTLAVEECSDGYFWSESQWFECHGSCKTWNSYGTCTECDTNYSMNSKAYYDFHSNECLATTGLCDWSAWSDGEFYSDSLEGCGVWSSSWSSLWAYQTHWFQWPSGEMLDLDTLSWVTSCDTDTQIEINDAQLQSIQLCRSLTYYVNPLSTSVTELGTQKHPYKELESVLVELMNFHAHTDRNISVMIMEQSTVYIKATNIIANITQVSFESYSENNLDAQKARIVGVKLSSRIVPPAMPSKFNILGRLQVIVLLIIWSSHTHYSW